MRAQGNTIFDTCLHEAAGTAWKQQEDSIRTALVGMDLGLCEVLAFEQPLYPAIHLGVSHP